MFKNILVLCLGNICRSPIAQHLLLDFSKREHLNLNIDSAGLTAMVDWPAHEYSIQIMQEQGIDLSLHRAKQVKAEHVTSADLILVMDDIQRQMLSRDFPYSSGKTYKIGEFTRVDIPDPYGEPFPAFQNAFKLIHEGLQHWQQQLR